jgi:hypothetical protein
VARVTYDRGSLGSKNPCENFPHWRYFTRTHGGYKAQYYSGRGDAVGSRDSGSHIRANRTYDPSNYIMYERPGGVFERVELPPPIVRPGEAIIGPAPPPPTPSIGPAQQCGD